MSDCEILNPKMDYFTQLLDAKAYKEGIPLRGTFELTPRCNFNCNMCYVHLTDAQAKAIGRELANEEWLDIARQAKDAGMLYLTLTGGEVFTRPKFRELYEALSDMGFLIQILTNGYFIDEKVMEWLKRKPPYELRFTLYGASNEAYEKVCGVKDGFGRVSRAIDLVLATDIPFYTVGTIVKENESDLQAMYQYAREKKFIFQHTIAVVHPARGATANAWEHRIDMTALTGEELKEVKKVPRFYVKRQSALEICGSYRKGFWLTWDGKLQLCSFMTYPAIDIKGREFLTAWERLLEELQSLRTPKECITCKYEGFCQRCPGVLAAECGGPEQVEQAFCNKAKALYEIYFNGQEEI